jgi:uncharacterized membrane protein YGL010W
LWWDVFLLSGFELLDSRTASLEVDGAGRVVVVVMVLFVGHGAGEERMAVILVLAALQQNQFPGRVLESCLEDRV